MASDKEYLEFILEQLSESDYITYRKMMGEYIIYYRDKVIGGIYDNRFLIKPTKTALLSPGDMALPYEGAKPMLQISDLENKEHLKKLIEAVYNELPEKKAKID